MISYVSKECLSLEISRANWPVRGVGAGSIGLGPGRQLGSRSLGPNGPKEPSLFDPTVESS